MPRRLPLPPVCSPLPPAGEGPGERAGGRYADALRRHARPLPHPSPRGRGEQTDRQQKRLQKLSLQRSLT
ncbi:hypothetical protein CBM2589_B30208 [Cupriavidus taiwanensis]|uniref:Uncharacterized protein n=1 Tax=Cupriavidus taiwanensis TaxID=164546 RepID=A0A375BUY6_9BURK|nr:hypothetical protein CBM2589_B30208 [Cupriavidus taiwanensis]